MSLLWMSLLVFASSPTAKLRAPPLFTPSTSAQGPEDPPHATPLVYESGTGSSKLLAYINGHYMGRIIKKIKEEQALC